MVRLFSAWKKSVRRPAKTAKPSIGSRWTQGLHFFPGTFFFCVLLLFSLGRMCRDAIYRSTNITCKKRVGRSGYRPHVTANTWHGRQGETKAPPASSLWLVVAYLQPEPGRLERLPYIPICIRVRILERLQQYEYVRIETQVLTYNRNVVGSLFRTLMLVSAPP